MYVFNMGTALQHFKDTITAVLQKLGKDDYAQPRAYRLITLLNTPGKVIEAIITNRLAYLAGEHYLLPSRYTGGLLCAHRIASLLSTY